MRKLLNSLRLFRKNEDGAALVEYAVLLGVVIAVGATIFTGIGTNASTIFSSASSMLTP
jgi:pilus assembly protein Flp/PilA